MTIIIYWLLNCWKRHRTAGPRIIQVLVFTYFINRWSGPVLPWSRSIAAMNRDLMTWIPYWTYVSAWSHDWRSTFPGIKAPIAFILMNWWVLIAISISILILKWSKAMRKYCFPTSRNFAWRPHFSVNKRSNNIWMRKTDRYPWSLRVKHNCPWFATQKRFEKFDC